MRGLQTELRRLRHSRGVLLLHHVARRYTCHTALSLSPRGRCPFVHRAFCRIRFTSINNRRLYDPTQACPRRLLLPSRRNHSAAQPAAVTDGGSPNHEAHLNRPEQFGEDEGDNTEKDRASAGPDSSNNFVQLPEQTPLDFKPFARYIYSSIVSPVNIIHIRSLALLLKGFFESDMRILQFYDCPSSSELVYKLAAKADLWVWRINVDYQSSVSRFCLVKKAHMVYTAAANSVIEEDLSPLINQALDDTLNLLKKGGSLGLSTALLNNHWPVLSKFCDLTVEAMPSLWVQIQDQEDMIRAEDMKYEARIQALIVRNDCYNEPISINSAADSSDAQDRMGFALMLVEYCRALQENATETRLTSALRFGTGTGYSSPGEFLQKAASILGYGNLLYRSEMDTNLSEATGLDFWRSDISFAKRPNVTLSATWLHRKSARILVTMRACLELQSRLEEAYKSERILPQEYQIFAKHWGEDVEVPIKVARDTHEQHINIPIAVADDTVARMVRALSELRENGFIHLDGHEFDPGLHERRIKESRGLSRISRIDRKFQKDRAVRANILSQSTEDSELLPLMHSEVSDQILTTIGANDITIITAATGSGKTTQIPQLLLDRYIDNGDGSLCNIICTQPRRVSTISVARRVAFERFQEIGQEVGYQVRFDDRPPGWKRGISYMTSGLFLRILESNHKNLLASLSHVILDEVHTRDIDTDLILTVLKNLMNQPSEKRMRLPKIVLMSASIDAEYFADYFKDLDVTPTVSCINIPGMTYPVTTTRLQDIIPLLEQRQPSEYSVQIQNKQLVSYVQNQISSRVDAYGIQKEVSTSDGDAPVLETDELDDLYVPTPLIPLVINNILNESSLGDILVFLPGLSEIEDVEERLLQGIPLGHDFNDTRSYKVFKLHSALYETNFDVFEPVPPQCRRIVLATNIAETSLTLPDVKFVIDTGLSRQNFYEQTMQSGQLKLVWISKAEVTQRRGRVGRTQPGQYLALYSDGQYNNMIERPQPELTRTSLTQIVLRVHESSAFRPASALDIGFGNMDPSSPGAVLLTAPSAPDESKVVAAGRQLRNLKAVSSLGQVTALGKTISSIPCTPSESKAILLGSIFRCLDPLIYYGAQVQDSQIIANADSTSTVATVRKNLAGTTYDDNIADAKAFFEYDLARRLHNTGQARSMRSDMFLRHDTYREISQTSNQIIETLSHVLGYNTKRNEVDASTPYLYPETSPALNVNSNNYNLVKALAMGTAGSRLAVWRRKDWTASTHPRILPSPRSVNHTSTKKSVREQRLTRENGDLLVYKVLRILPKDKYPWACDTSIVPPMSGILFAESVRLVDGNKLMINEWAYYTVQTISGQTDFSAKVIMEYRKALDRFLNLALEKISLQPPALEKVITGEVSADEFNTYLGEKDHPHRKIIVDSVIDILAIEARERNARMEIRRLDTECVEEAGSTSGTEESSSLTEKSDF